jgi:valyl-tRNA synthetase
MWGDARSAPTRRAACRLLTGRDRFDARAAIVAMLEAEGRLVKVEPHHHSIRKCYRCETVVEPRLSEQWFVRMAPLAQPALNAVRDRTIRILPERWEAVYVNWLEGIRDWNISRQLWWGHRIPVWYCDACGKVTASQVDIERCPACSGTVRQDEDVLDTWFSSGLWPFSTLGWPDDSADLRAFYPTDLLVTAPEILFFWVARMIMMGYAFMGEEPFHTVYLHGTVRDTNHVKMSKSLGNGIDPLDVVALYGADALRYTVVAGMGLGADTILDPADLERSFAPGRNFVTKLWNIGRFLLSNVGTDPVDRIHEVDPALLVPADRWILQRLDEAVAACNAALGPARPDRHAWSEEQRYAGLRLNEYTEAARGFVWSELADWYLEAAKSRLSVQGADRDVARAVLVHAFDGALRLLHPIVPFVTETLWQRLPRPDRTASEADHCGVAHGAARSRWRWRLRDRARGGDCHSPAARRLQHPSGQGGHGFARPRVIPRAVSFRPKPRLSSDCHAARYRDRCSAGRRGGTSGALRRYEIILPLAGMIDVSKECARLKGELESRQAIAWFRGRLANEQFVARAKPEVVDAERAKERDWTARRAQLAASRVAVRRLRSLAAVAGAWSAAHRHRHLPVGRSTRTRHNSSACAPIPTRRTSARMPSASSSTKSSANGRRGLRTWRSCS